MATVLMLWGIVGTAFGADNADPPPSSSPVKLIFIHHSTGGYWLADPNSDNPYGGLGTALMNNNYYVSATNYEWGYEAIGSRTDIPNWPEWFTGPNSSTILNAVYNETGQNVYTSDDWRFFGYWSRLSNDPGGENEIVMFKSCFPNSNLSGNPNDPPLSAPDEQYGVDNNTVSNAKAVYNKILTYFRTRQDKLFVVITAPPLMQSDTDATHAANARAFNNWLVNDWLDGYAYKNVAVFDYYNVLTDPDNHHRWYNNAVQHVIGTNSNFAYYPSGDSHPSSAGHQKAAAEFVPLLNVFYHRWKEGGSATTTTTVSGTTSTTVRPSTTTTTAAVTTTTSSASTTTTTSAVSTTTTTNFSSTTTTTTVPSVADLQKAMAALEISAGMPASGIALSDDVNSDRKIGLPEAISALKGKPVSSGDLVQPADFEYLGAFRLPGEDDTPKTFNYGGNAMTFNPDRNPSDSDGFPGSLFITGHDRQAYGDLPDGDQVAEVSIPVPKKAENPEELPQAEFIQEFYDVTAGYFKELEEVPKVGMQYLNHPDTGPKIHLCWGKHLQMSEENLASHGWFDATLSAPNFKGVWFIGNRNPNSVNAYILDIPTGWADTYLQGRYLGTGRVHGGGLGGMGPALIAYRPWQSGGAAPASGTHLEETALLLYESSLNTEKIEKCMKGYQHPDLWEGGAWITTPSGKTAVLFAGDKSNGTKYWYGYMNPLGPNLPCIDEASVADSFPNDSICRMADGSTCPPGDYVECANHTSDKGWWSTRYDAQIILYNPEELAKVASGAMDSWEPQPYVSIDIDEHLYLNPPVWDIPNLGAGDQRRFRLGDVAYDRTKGILYILELYADGAKPVVHVWKIL